MTHARRHASQRLRIPDVYSADIHAVLAALLTVQAPPMRCNDLRLKLCAGAAAARHQRSAVDAVPAAVHAVDCRRAPCALGRRQRSLHGAHCRVSFRQRRAHRRHGSFRPSAKPPSHRCRCGCAIPTGVCSWMSGQSTSAAACAQARGPSAKVQRAQSVIGADMRRSASVPPKPASARLSMHQNDQRPPSTAAKAAVRQSLGGAARRVVRLI